MTVNLQNSTTYGRILRDMSEGVIILGLDGIVQYTNQAAADILGMEVEEIINHSLASLFFLHEENDSFTQTIVNVVLHPEQTNFDLVPFYTGAEYRQLNVTTSFLREGEEKRGIIMMLSDITEIFSLKIRYTRQITDLLNSLVKALSVAIDERSKYTANHTRNMVKMGAAFLEWLDRTESPRRLAENRKRAFLMSIWLHDVGKLTIPVEIMDKATRLGAHVENICQRMEKCHLLDRIALLEGRIDGELLALFKESRAWE